MFTESQGQYSLALLENTVTGLGKCFHESYYISGVIPL